MNISKEQFIKLAKEHLIALESYKMDKNGNKPIEIFGIEKLYEAIKVIRCCESDSEQLILFGVGKNEAICNCENEYWKEDEGGDWYCTIHDKQAYCCERDSEQLSCKCGLPKSKKNG